MTIVAKLEEKRCGSFRLLRFWLP